MDASPITALEPFFAVMLGVLGLNVGSFLNVVMLRVPEGRSIVRPRSACPRCGHPLSWYENIPLLSWVALRGRCRTCRSPISARYPLFEALTSILFMLALVRFGWTWQLVSALTFITVLLPLIVIDAEHWILPFELTLPGIALGLLLSVPMGRGRWVDALVGAAVGFCAFRAMEYLGWKAFKQEAMGAGDKFLVAMVGAFLTWKALLAVIFLSAFQGALYGGVRLYLTGRAGPADEVPEGDGGDEGGKADAEPTMTWRFLAPGLPLWRRLLLLPYCVLLQPIPDEPVDEEGEEVEWTPGRTNLPFGPWIGLAALELLFAGAWLARHAPARELAWLFSTGEA